MTLEPRPWCYFLHALILTMAETTSWHSEPASLMTTEPGHGATSATLDTYFHLENRARFLLLASSKICSSKLQTETPEHPDTTAGMGLSGYPGGGRYGQSDSKTRHSLGNPRPNLGKSGVVMVFHVTPTSRFPKCFSHIWKVG